VKTRTHTYEASCPYHSHRSYRTLAKCLWPRACWIAGNGPWASLAYCRVLTIELHSTRERAEQAKRMIDSTGCGGGCYRQHKIARLGLE
jgi:hypothetical protein